MMVYIIQYMLLKYVTPTVSTISCIKTKQILNTIIHLIQTLLDTYPIILPFTLYV